MNYEKKDNIRKKPFLYNKLIPSVVQCYCLFSFLYPYKKKNKKDMR